ncbi:MAG: hypothetical protein ACJAQ3_002447 [Planctomycetota bacterium]|jgi:hypothetical protein
MAAMTLVILALGPFLSAQEPLEPAASVPVDFAPVDFARVDFAPAGVRTALDLFCAKCHGTNDPKGEVRLDAFVSLAPGERVDLLRSVSEVIQFEEMPPAGEPQPSVEERAELLRWINTGLDGTEDAELRDKLRYPHYGNLVDHDRLFAVDVDVEAAPVVASTPARRWLVSPQIFHERVMDVFKLAGRDRDGKQHGAFVGVTNPFLLNDQSGVRYYDLDALDGGDLLVMLGNARWIADRQIAMARRLGGETIEFENKKDRWLPRSVPESYASFTEILGLEADVREEQMRAAIREQFDCVLRREATPEELANYLALTRSAIELGGYLAGLRQMLIAVLLESEFVYRMEFGDGPVDRHGRRPLAAQEAAYAISYALGDRRPDSILMAAADEGRLRSKQDYEREVRRLLDDDSYYRGQIDPSLNGKHFKSNVTSHPRIIRFFREFFGYTTATKVFKDPPRSGGIYRNPGRGTTATPGRLVLETDRIVTRVVEQDSDVFAQLLTTDEFFVYHDKEGAAGRLILDEWREVYDRLKDTDWKTEPERVLTEHLEFLQGMGSMRIKDASRPGELVNFMHYFDEHFGRGLEPFTTVPWAHGYTFHHAPLYNLPSTPSIGRYGHWKSSKYRGEEVSPKTFWDYPVEQPFRIEHRMGLLTHPSWLIAHSTNFHPDAVRRGRWIREKLLAGRVPDVPITVDAQVPDDPHRTFRERVESVTMGQECWRCHQHMNPLGLPFEAFDDFGRFRTVEPLEHPDNLIERGNGKTTFDVYPTAPVVTTGRLDGTGDAGLDGDVADPFELIERLARSDRVRQSIIRHAFRFYMGRNETLADSRALIDADQAYLESGGRFREVIVSLITSDSFRFRKQAGD